MKKTSLAYRSSLAAMLASCAQLATGCQSAPVATVTTPIPAATGTVTAATPPPAQSEARDTLRVHVRITPPQGDAIELDDDFAHLIKPFTRQLQPFLADGEETTDARAVLTAQDVELRLLGGDALHIVRDGDTLRSDDTRAVADGATLRVGPALTHVELENRAGVTSIDVEGLDAGDADLARFVGTMAVLTLGAEGRMPQLDASTREIATATVIVVVLAVSWLTCVFGGSAMCSHAAATSCGEGNVSRYHQNCGVGYTSEDGLQLGFACSFSCNG